MGTLNTFLILEKKEESLDVLFEKKKKKKLSYLDTSEAVQGACIYTLLSM